jgi:hypothetical protein
MPWTLLEAPEGTEFFSDTLVGLTAGDGAEYLGGWYWEDGQRWFRVRQAGETFDIGDEPTDPQVLSDIRDIELEGTIPVYKKDGKSYRSINGELTPCNPDGTPIPAPALFTPDIPDHPWIFNRRRPDGTYPDPKEFFNRPIGGDNE